MFDFGSICRPTERRFEAPQRVRRSAERRADNENSSAQIDPNLRPPLTLTRTRTLSLSLTGTGSRRLDPAERK